MRTRNDDPIAIDALNAASGDRDPQVRLRAISYLLWVGQVDALPMAVVALADGSLDPFLLNFLRMSIARGMRSEAALPMLEQLLQFPEAETRRAAARAMQEIESPLIIEPLRLALDDAYSEVRLAAVRGLARALGEPTFFPGDVGFRIDEARYIEPLRSLADRIRMR